MVTTKVLYQKFLDATEFAELKNYSDKIIFIDISPTRSGSIKIVRQHLKTYRGKTLIHYVLWYPLNFSFRKDRTLYTFPGYSLSYLSISTKSLSLSHLIKDWDGKTKHHLSFPCFAVSKHQNSAILVFCGNVLGLQFGW